MNYIANIDTICILINIENYETFNKKLFEFLSNEKEKNFKYIMLADSNTNIDKPNFYCTYYSNS